MIFLVLFFFMNSFKSYISFRKITEFIFKLVKKLDTLDSVRVIAKSTTFSGNSPLMQNGFFKGFFDGFAFRLLLGFNQLGLVPIGIDSQWLQFVPR